MADLKVNIGRLSLKNPVMTASGTFGYGLEFADFIDLSRLGGIIVKGTTLKAREGNPYPRMAETPSGMMHSAVPNKYLDTLAEASDIFTQGIPVSLINFWMGLGDAPLQQKRHRQ